MILLALLAFGFGGWAMSSLKYARTAVILLLSAGTIAIISPLSILFCAVLASINYFIAFRLPGNKPMLILCILFDLLALFCFHWYGEYVHFSDKIKGPYPAKVEEGPLPGLPAIFGMAFLIIQLIDYSLRVFFWQVKPGAGYISYLAALLYFPKFFSGPVTTVPEIIEQLSIKNEERNNTAYGLNRILLGLFKKLVLAESMALIVHSVFDFHDPYSGMTILTGAMVYALQLYFDFSGYSDLAVGISSLWGIRLPENFNFPFRQGSWSGFWRVWHASLTNWLWQYLFNPVYLVCTRRKVNKNLARAGGVLLVFLGMAFFNGLNPGYYVSAGFLASFYIIGIPSGKGGSFVSGPLIFLLFSIGLLYFRNPRWEEYSFLSSRLFDLKQFIPGDWLKGYFAPLASGGRLGDYFNLGITLFLSLLFLLFERKVFRVFSVDKINYVAWFIVVTLIFSWGVFTNGERFIYMQF